MAWPSYTLAQVVTLVRQRADMVNSELVGTTELRQYITDSVASLSDLLISVQGGMQWSLKEDMPFDLTTTEDGNVIRASFYKLLGVGLKWPRTGATERILWLEPLTIGAEVVLKREDWATCQPRYRLGRNPGFVGSTAPTLEQGFHLSLFPLPSSAWTVRVEFFPLFRFDSDSQIISLPFPDFVILDAAAKCATKEQNAELAGLLVAERDQIEKRIRTWASPIDRGQPGFLTDIRGDLAVDADSVGGWR